MIELAYYEIDLPALTSLTNQNGYSFENAHCLELKGWSKWMIDFV